MVVATANRNSREMSSARPVIAAGGRLDTAGQAAQRQRLTVRLAREPRMAPALLFLPADKQLAQVSDPFQ